MKIVKLNPQLKIITYILFISITLAAQNNDNIWTASFNGDFSSVKGFIEGGTSVDALDKDKRSPLMFAAFNGHFELVDWLIKQEAKIDIEDVEGRTALMFSSTSQSLDTIELLLKSKANINHADKAEGFTSLMFAAGEGHLESVKLLVKYGANSKIKDQDGDTALNHAYNNKHVAVVEYLMNK
jgi:ankyrin repeat protein